MKTKILLTRKNDFFLYKFEMAVDRGQFRATANRIIVYTIYERILLRKRVVDIKIFCVKTSSSFKMENFKIYVN